MGESKIKESGSGDGRQGFMMWCGLGWVTGCRICCGINSPQIFAKLLSASSSGVGDFAGGSMRTAQMGVKDRPERASDPLELELRGAPPRAILGESRGCDG